MTSAELANPSPQLALQRDGLVPQRTADASFSTMAANLVSPSCCVHPDLRRGRATKDIAADDWDLLFRAALEVLAFVAVEKPVPGLDSPRLQVPGTVLRECLSALDQLRRTAPGHGIQPPT